MWDEGDRLRPIMFDRRYGWEELAARISDGFGREGAQLDWAVWDAELALEQSIAPPAAPLPANRDGGHSVPPLTALAL